MERNQAVLLGLLLVLLAVDYSLADTKVDVTEKVDSELKTVPTGKSNDKVSGSDVDLEKVGGDNGVKVGGEKPNSSLINQTSSKDGDNVQKGNGDSSKESIPKENDEKNGKLDAGADHQEVNGGKENKPDSTLSTPLRKENSRYEECDPSNMCNDTEDKFVACLRVPGNESPNLSLLIQNKGRSPIFVKISAPNYVQLEKTEVQLQEKENSKVMVSIGSGGTESLINLKSGNGQCSLDFKDVVAHNTKKDSTDPKKPAYTNYLSPIPIIVFMLCVALLILISTWVVINYRRRRLSSNGSKYQRMDMELPVSDVVAKPEPDISDAWDNSWGDDSWDDEEAPKTPSMPLTPSFSSKGVASRRMNKDGWKD